MKNWSLLRATLLGSLHMATSLCAVEIHVGARGADANPGTDREPLATLHAAQERVRAMVARGLQEPVGVIIHGGTYHLPRPLELRPQDSGTAAFPITWRAVAGEKVGTEGTNGYVVVDGLQLIVE